MVRWRTDPAFTAFLHSGAIVPARHNSLTGLNVSGRNHLLSLLPAVERKRIVERCQRVRLEQHTVVYPAKSDIEHAYFPLSGVVSLMLGSAEGATVQVGMTGNEGMLGVSLVLGVERSQLEAVIQVSGEFMRMARTDLEHELDGGGALRPVVQRFAHTLTNQIAQSVLCNRLHSVEQRLCRWFLMTHDRVGAGAAGIFLTQEFVAQMLGVRRPSVTEAVGVLQKAGLVTYSRGRLEILDRKGLETGACECYRIVQQETQRLLLA